MSERYSYKDVIIDPEDPRVEVGAEYYFEDMPKSVISNAQEEVGALRPRQFRGQERPQRQVDKAS